MADTSTMSDENIADSNNNPFLLTREGALAQITTAALASMLFDADDLSDCSSDTDMARPDEDDCGGWLTPPNRPKVIEGQTSCKFFQLAQGQILIFNPFDSCVSLCI